MNFSFLHHIGLIALFSMLYVAVAQTNYRNISLGWSLTASDDSASWPAPSGDFAFGFRRLENQNLYLLSIWYDKIPNKTLVWYANGDNPAPQGSRVELTMDGLFSLTDPGGGVIWRPSPVSVVYAAMLDTGNFILGNNDSSNVWQSFDDPADTLLPAQILRVNRSVSARTTETNFTRGRFELRLIPDGNLVLNTIALPTGNAYEAYYWSNTVDAPDGTTGNQLIFNASRAYLYIIKTNGEIVNVTSGNIGQRFPTRDYYHRATVDYDGVLRLYAHPRTSRNGRWDETWSTTWYAPNDICSAITGERGGGTCGFNTYCSIENDGRPNCHCLPGFNFSDPNNKLNGCEQDTFQKCNLEGLRAEDLYDMNQLNNWQWYNSAGYEDLQSLSDDQCRSSCLYDCHCFLAVSIGGTCTKKKLPVSNGRRLEGGSDSIFVKVLKSDLSSGDPSSTRSNLGKRNQATFSLVAALLLGSSGFLNLLLVAAILIVIVLRSYAGRTKLRKLPSLLDTNLRTFTYEELKVTTDKFKEELGRGSFGTVYKGMLPLSGSRILVAIKELYKISQEGEKEFKTEASVIAKIHHKNLVRLIGFCDEESHKLLEFEYMSNG
ncbi:hypothetical protein ACH5RR_023481 [Cinchona calisaya]|uniref:non-specific serine/threonine protein kinase n=1 Tax=Cinchona calisaya TaxID=153742 RepID=A0ABD2ZCB3_9GENT